MRRRGKQIESGRSTMMAAAAISSIEMLTHPYHAGDAAHLIGVVSQGQIDP